LLVLSLGRLSKAKGAGELLQAFAVAASACDTLHLVLVGAMPAFDDSQLVMTMIERDSRLRGRVTVRPACSPDEVSDFYYSADIFAFASPREGMPNALLEAMAAGLPAVAFAIPAVKEIDGGEECLLTIPPLDCEAFAHAILRLAGSPQRRRELASKGSRAVRARFNIEVNVERALAVVRALTHADPCLGDTRGRSVGGGMETWK
jgi:glycosyltransferase involved in cell wall biosynthesis